MADGLSVKVAVGSRTTWPELPYRIFPTLFFHISKGVLFCLLCLSFLSEQWQMAGAVMAVGLLRQSSLNFSI